MAVLDPVTPFLALIDRLISLVNARKTHRSEYFQKIIEPLYTQFTPLAEDYLELFRMAKKVFDEPKRSRKAQLVEISSKREKFMDSRVRLRVLLETCEKHAKKKKKDEELISFLRAMLRFFIPMVETSRLSSLGRQLVDFMILWVHGERAARSANQDVRTARYLEAAPREVHYSFTPMFKAYVDGASARLEASWYEISGRYMELKLKYSE